MQKLNRILGIESKLSMVFYPQIDKQIEKVNQELNITNFIWTITPGILDQFQ